ncbi:MAG: sugar transferase [Ktedonobacteraceae bacterium]
MMTTGATGPIIKAISKRRLYRRQWRIFGRIALIVLDAALIALAFYLAYLLRYSVIGNSRFLNNIRTNLEGNIPASGFYDAPLSSFALLDLGVVVVLIMLFTIRGLYTIRLTGTLFRQIRTIVVSATIGEAILITYFFVFQPPSSSRLIAPLVWVIAIILLSLGRLLVAGIMSMLYRLGLAETRLLIVGSGRLGKVIMQNIAANPGLGYAIVGFLHDTIDPPGDFGRFRMLGTLEDLGLVIRSMQVDEVIIALPSSMNEQAIKMVRLCERFGSSFKLVPDLYELSLSRIDMETIEGIPLLNIKQVPMNTWQDLVTRLIDVTGSLLILFLSTPFWLLIALAIRLDSAGEIIYTQTRIGQTGRPFKMYKFRSMYKNAEQMQSVLWEQNEAQGPMFKIKDDPRVTHVGKFLRRTSLDEFPQFLNIIRGEMSLVGPRPPLPSEVATYQEWQKERLAIKPGLTGLWQVRGRSDISFDEGVLMDLYYIQNWSLHLYFQILFRTIPAVLRRRGAY